MYLSDATNHSDPAVLLLVQGLMAGMRLAPVITYLEFVSSDATCPSKIRRPLSATSIYSTFYKRWLTIVCVCVCVCVYFILLPPLLTLYCITFLNPYTIVCPRPALPYATVYQAACIIGFSTNFVVNLLSHLVSYELTAHSSYTSPSCLSLCMQRFGPAAFSRVQLSAWTYTVASLLGTGGKGDNWYQPRISAGKIITWFFLLHLDGDTEAIIPTGCGRCFALNAARRFTAFLKVHQTWKTLVNT